MYPKVYKDFISKLNPINLDLDFVLSYSCLVPHDFYHRLLFATIAPLGAFAVLAGSYLFAKKRYSSGSSRRRSDFRSHFKRTGNSGGWTSFTGDDSTSFGSSTNISSGGNNNSGKLGRIHGSSSNSSSGGRRTTSSVSSGYNDDGSRGSPSGEVAVRTLRQRHQGAAIYLAFIVYSPVSYKIFRTFACDALDDGGVYLRADYSLSCSSSRHAWYEAYAFVMVGVYPIGIAACFAWLLFWHRRDLVKPDRESIVRLKALDGMWSAYKPSRYFFEVVECGRRISLTAIAAFVLPNSTAQISIVLLVAVAFVFISEALSPFQKSVDMGLYRWGNGIVVSSMYVAFLMKIDVGHDKAYALLTFSGILIAANVFMVVAVFVQTALLVKELRGAKHRVRPTQPSRGYLR